MYNRNWWEHSAQRSLAHLLQTNSSGMGSASGMPWQRVCIHTPHTSQATMRSPSSTRVPHLQLTTQSSKPPAKQQITLAVGLQVQAPKRKNVSVDHLLCVKTGKSCSRITICNWSSVQEVHYACQGFGSKSCLACKNHLAPQRLWLHCCRAM